MCYGGSGVPVDFSFLKTSDLIQLKSNKHIREPEWDGQGKGGVLLNDTFRNVCVRSVVAHGGR